MDTYLVCKCICQRQIWSWVRCKNECCCIFSHDEQFSTSKGHNSIYGRQSSSPLAFSGRGEGDLCQVLTNRSQTLRFSSADPYCLPFFTLYAQRSHTMAGQGQKALAALSGSFWVKTLASGSWKQSSLVGIVGIFDTDQKPMWNLNLL